MEWTGSLHTTLSSLPSSAIKVFLIEASLPLTTRRITWPVFADQMPHQEPAILQIAGGQLGRQRCLGGNLVFAGWSITEREGLAAAGGAGSRHLKEENGLVATQGCFQRLLRRVSLNPLLPTCCRAPLSSLDPNTTAVCCSGRCLSVSSCSAG